LALRSLTRYFTALAGSELMPRVIAARKKGGRSPRYSPRYHPSLKIQAPVERYLDYGNKCTDGLK
jgi:hypothetical protein